MPKGKTKLQNVSFWIFVIAAVILFISPILLKIDCIKVTISWLLLDLNSFKSDYIALVGGMVGAGLAVSSAIYVQSRANIAKKIEEAEIEKMKKKIRMNIISSYIERAIIMLWGLWIWSRYETPYRDGDEEGVPYEPYKVNQEHISEYFFEIETDLSESSTSTFYNLLYFTETVNGYIEYYMSAYRQEMYIDSSGVSMAGDVNFKTHYRSSTRLYEITRILCNLIDDKKMELFFQDNSEFKSWNDYYMKRTAINNQLNETEEEVLKKINNDRNLVSKEEKFNLTSKRILSKWLMFKDDEDIDDSYIGYVEKITSIKSDLVSLDEKYKENMKNIISGIDSPQYSVSIENLLKELKTQ